MIKQEETLPESPAPNGMEIMKNLLTL